MSSGIWIDKASNLSLLTYPPSNYLSILIEHSRVLSISLLLRKLTVENKSNMGSSISQEIRETASAVQADTVTGSHFFKVSGYSLTKGIGVGRYITSDVFTIGGCKWVIRYYPDGESDESRFLSFFLEIKSESPNVKARFSFTILQQNGAPSDMYEAYPVCTFRSTSGTSNYCRGYKRFVAITDFERSKCLKNDAFTLKCTVTIVKGTKLETTSPYGVVVPPSNLNQNLINMFETGKGADVVFVVKGERFSAHRCVLATRSDVFNAMFFCGMKEKVAHDITVNDIEVPIFRSMLYFIYSDSVPDFATASNDHNKMKDLSSIAQHLLVAADRYGLERLKLICEDILCKNLDVDTVTIALILAEQRNCNQLKKECLRFMSSAEAFKAVALTPGFHDLMKICPSIVMNLKALYLN